MFYDLLGASPSPRSPLSVKRTVGYGDTDSNVYIHCSGLSDPLLSDYLGDFKDKLSNGDYIVEFASGVPKTTCTVRGLSVNSGGSCQMNYQVLQQNVLGDI